MAARKLLSTAFVATLLVSCVSSHGDPVVLAVTNRAGNNGRLIMVSGTFRERNGYYNLFSSDGQECIGILTTDRQKIDYRSFVGQKVSVVGILQAEGCGREGICVEHLCGPTIMTGVTISR